MDALTADTAIMNGDTAELATDTEPAAPDLQTTLRSWQEWQQSYNDLYKRHVDEQEILRQQISACQASYNELYARNVRLCDELTAAHEIIERLQRSEVPPDPNVECAR
jgi:hypothetical protein